MPELPEVETVRRSLLPHLHGRAVIGVHLRRRDVVAVVDDDGDERELPRGGRAAAALLLEGQTVTGLERRGKQLAIVSPGPVLVVHLGMTGQLFCVPPGGHLPNPTHVHVLWKLDSGARLVFRDPRRFGGVWSLPTREALAARWRLLGPDALTITREELVERLARTRRAVKSALLDQSVLAGVGNIYADESLFMAGIRPTAVAARLAQEKVEKLADAIRTVLAQAVEAKGSSLSDYVDGNGDKGSFQLAHAVYARGGQPCVSCRSPLKSRAISNRTTVWCPRCQPR